MGFLQLTGGAYTSRSLVAAAQRCLNLYVEGLPPEEGEPFPTVHYCTPGLTFVANTGQERCRALYTSFDGTLYAVYNQSVYRVAENNQFFLLGKFQGSDPSDVTERDTPVSMCDNGAILLIVDGTVDGYFVDITKKPGDQKLVRIDRGINQGFLGADHVAFQDTFFLLNRPDTAQYYISLSNIDNDNLTASFNVFFTALTSVKPTGDTKVGDKKITNLSSTDGIIIGMLVTGAGIPQGTVTVVSIDSTTQITLSVGAYLTGTAVTLTITHVNTGSGYTVDDVLDLPGTGGAQVTVNAVDDSGAITFWGTTDAGAVLTKPANPITATGGTGTGAVFDVTYQDNIGGWDALDFATMTGQANRLVAVVSMHRNAWMIGSTSCEVWINSGGEGSIAGSFPFIIYQDAFMDWGCAAKYSIVSVMNQIFWLSKDKFGKGIIMRAEALTSKRISTHAIEQVISTYDRIDDAIGMAYQQGGHAFYLLTFPSANESRGATWCFDATSNMWHERCFIDENGIEYRHVANAISAAYNRVYVGDWRNGNLYVFDLDNYTDNGWPIKRLRSFPHQIDMESSRRIMYSQLIAQMQVGSAGNATTSSNVIATDFDAPDGTLLENYHNINSIGANFTQISGEGEIVDDAVVQSDNGTMLYLASGTPTTANYSVSYTMTPTGYEVQPRTGQSMFVIARADPSYNGYKAAVVSDGANYSIVLTVMPSTTHPVVLGTLSAGSYRVIMLLQGSTISVSVLRTSDGLWVSPSGIWGTVSQPCISIEDGTYTLAGRILVGATAGTAMAMASLAGFLASTGRGDPNVTGMAMSSLTGLGNTAGIGVPSINGSVAPLLTGLAGAARSGVVSPSSSMSSLISGIAASAVAGTPLIGAGPSLALTGLAAAVARGSPVISRSTSPSVVGRSAASAIGTTSIYTGATPPSQAVSAGYSNLVFEDDFDTTSTIANSGGATSGSGFKWYWVSQVDSYFTHVGSWSVNPSAFAGGSNASSDGGILTFNVQRGGFSNTFWGNSVLCSIPAQTMSASSIPANCAWKHGYIEFYAQTSLVTSPNIGDPFNGGWPALWAAPVESLANGGFGAGNPAINILTADGTEVDFIESQGGVFGNPSGNNQFNVENPAFIVPGVYGLTYPVMDTGWHTYGFLWTPGHIRVYYDNVAVAVAQSTAAWNLESCNLFLIIGSGINWPLAIDWVRVWQ